MKVEEWLSTELGVRIWEKKYRYKQESFDSWILRVSGGDQQIAQLLLEKKFLFGGRTLTNRGVDNGSMSNCYSSGFVLDNLADIMAVNTKLALTYKAQGGQGVSLSKIRPKGSLIRGLYESDGIVPIMEMYNTTTASIIQGGSRKGALMISLDIKHKEAETFITIKSDPTKITKANLSVEIDNEFMEAVEKFYTTGEVIKLHITREYEGQLIAYDIVPIHLYKLLMERAWQSAEPGVIFTDKFRNYNLMEFCDDYQIETSNPCLHPNTVIETSEGKVKIKDMTKSMMVYSMDDEGKLVLKKASPSWITKQNTKTINIHINNGQVLTCTPDHKIFIEGKGWIEAQNIKLGDSPIALLRRRRGAKYSGVRLSSQKAGSDVMEHRFIYEGHYGKIEEGYDIHHIDEDSYNNSIDNLECLSHSEHSTLTRLSCDNDHQIKDEETGQFISSEIKKPKTIIPLPEDLATNFKSKARVIKISEGETTDVYDITVEDTHNFVADGIIVHNCGEQPLPKDGACNLGSINLSQYVLNPFTKNAEFDYNSLVADVASCIRALDQVVDENLPKHGLPEQAAVSKKYRNVGLGIMGLADAFIKLGIKYGSEESVAETRLILEVMLIGAVESSSLLAAEKGVFPAYDPKIFDSQIISNSIYRLENLNRLKTQGLRNCSLLSIAPTGSLGTMFNVSTGIEPNFAFEFNRKTESLEGNKEKIYKVSAGIVKEYLDYLESIGQPFTELPEYFVSAYDVQWKDRIAVQAAAQQFVDTAISATINLPKDISKEEVEMLYLEAWKSGLKGVTIYRDTCRDAILSIQDQVTSEFFHRPAILQAKVVHFVNDSKPWVAFVGIRDNKPFEIFTGPADMEVFPIPKSVKQGEIIKVKIEGQDSRYDFRYTDSYGYQNTLGGLSRCFNKEFYNYARLVSGMLRQQIEITAVLAIVGGMQFENETLNSWKNGVIRALKEFIQDGTLAAETCPECGSSVIYTEGCKQCPSCGWGKC